MKVLVGKRECQILYKSKRAQLKTNTKDKLAGPLFHILFPGFLHGRQHDRILKSKGVQLKTRRIWGRREILWYWGGLINRMQRIQTMKIWVCIVRTVPDCSVQRIIHKDRQSTAVKPYEFCIDVSHHFPNVSCIFCIPHIETKWTYKMDVAGSKTGMLTNQDGDQNGKPFPSTNRSWMAQAITKPGIWWCVD